MFHNMLSSRAIQIGIAFFVFVVGGSLLYSWHAYETTKAELTEIPPFQERAESLNAARAAPVDVAPPGDVLPTPEDTEPQRYQATDDSESFDERETFSLDALFAEALPADVPEPTDAFLTETPLSPNGFGPLPAVPSDYPNQNVWSEERLARITPEHELLSRVRIELWNQGVRTEGAVYRTDYGRIYPTTDDVVYIQWNDAPAADGEMYVVNMLGTPKTINAYEEDIYRGIFRPHLTIYEYPDGGIDPYTFLGL